MRWVCMTFVDCLPVVKGGVAFSVEEASSKKNRQTESGAFLPLLMCSNFLHFASMLKHDKRHCELCVRETFVVHMPMVKGGVKFGAKEAPMKKNQLGGNQRAFISLL